MSLNPPIQALPVQPVAPQDHIQRFLASLTTNAQVPEPPSSFEHLLKQKKESKENSAEQGTGVESAGSVEQWDSEGVERRRQRRLRRRAKAAIVKPRTATTKKKPSKDDDGFGEEDDDDRHDKTWSRPLQDKGLRMDKPDVDNEDRWNPLQIKSANIFVGPDGRLTLPPSLRASGLTKIKSSIPIRGPAVSHRHRRIARPTRLSDILEEDEPVGRRRIPPVQSRHFEPGPSSLLSTGFGQPGPSYSSKPIPGTTPQARPAGPHPSQRRIPSPGITGSTSWPSQLNKTPPEQSAPTIDRLPWSPEVALASRNVVHASTQSETPSILRPEHLVSIRPKIAVPQFYCFAPESNAGSSYVTPTAQRYHPYTLVDPSSNHGSAGYEHLPHSVSTTPVGPPSWSYLPYWMTYSDPYGHPTSWVYAPPSNTMPYPYFLPSQPYQPSWPYLGPNEIYTPSHLPARHSTALYDAPNEEYLPAGNERSATNENAPSLHSTFDQGPGDTRSLTDLDWFGRAWE